jgi:hypothetical protein
MKNIYLVLITSLLVTTSCSRINLPNMWRYLLMKKIIFLVLLAMVVFSSNASAQTECGTVSKKTVTGAEARLQMEALKATDPDKRFPTFEDDCSEKCNNRDIVVWGQALILGGRSFYGISLCTNFPKEDRFDFRSIYPSKDDEFKLMWVKD